MTFKDVWIFLQRCSRTMLILKILPGLEKTLKKKIKDFQATVLTLNKVWVTGPTDNLNQPH